MPYDPVANPNNGKVLEKSPSRTPRFFIAVTFIVGALSVFAIVVYHQVDPETQAGLLRLVGKGLGGAAYLLEMISTLAAEGADWLSEAAAALD